MAETQAPVGEEEQQRLFYSVTGFLESVAAARPVALFIDDLHWADKSSLRLLQYIARHTRSARVLLVATYRDVEINRRHPLEQALRDMNREGLMEEVQVRRLDRAGTTALTSATLENIEVSDEFTELLYRHTQGNPFYTHEVLRALVERGDLYEKNGRWEALAIEDIEIPKSVRSTVGELYSFNHALTQEVLYEEIPPRRRRRLHLAAGEATKRSRRVSIRSAELAWHFLQGDDPVQALHFALLAGDDAERLSAHAEAQEHFRNASELAGEIGDSQSEMTALERLGDVLSIVGPFDAAVSRYEKADCLALSLDNREVQRRCIAHTLMHSGTQWLSNDGIVRRVSELLEDQEPSAGLAELHIALSGSIYHTGRYVQSEEEAAKAADIARTIGSDYLLATAEMRRGSAVAQGDITRGTDILENAIRLAETTENYPALGAGLNNVALDYMMQAEFEKNLSCLLRAYDVAQEKRHFFGLIFFSWNIVAACIRLGKMGKAREYAAIVEGYRDRFDKTGTCICLGTMKLMDGEFAEADDLIDEALALAADSGDPEISSEARAAKRELCLLRDDPLSALAVPADLKTAGLSQLELWTAAEVNLECGNTAVAGRIIDRMIAGSPMQQTEGLRLRGKLAARNGDCETALRSLNQGVQMAHRQKYRSEEGRALHDLGKTLILCGDRKAGAARLEEARKLFAEMDARAYLKRTEKELAHLAET